MARSLQGPRLVYAGPGRPSVAADLDYARMEETVRIQEHRAYVRALRLIAVQTQLWTPEQLAKAINRTADRIERRVNDPDGQAA